MLHVICQVKKSVRKSQCDCKPNDKLDQCSVCEELCSECICDDEYCRDHESCNKDGFGVDNFTDRHSECCGEIYKNDLEEPEFFDFEIDGKVYACDVGCKICAEPEKFCHPDGQKISFAEARRRITEKYSQRREQAKVNVIQC